VHIIQARDAWYNVKQSASCSIDTYIMNIVTDNNCWVENNPHKTFTVWE